MTSPRAMKPPRVEFCGEWYQVDPETPFYIGRGSDLDIDDNPHLHRQFLEISAVNGLWWLSNVGTVLSATVSDQSGKAQAWLAPGARLPIVFEQMHVLFSAGSTTYDFMIHSEDEFFSTSSSIARVAGSTTMDPIPLTRSQRLLLIALAEHVLRRTMPGRGEIPPSTKVAERLGWSITTFNRKLDNVCDKLDRFGVSGLRGERGKIATQRRARLVEYAVSTRLVTEEDLILLERPFGTVENDEE